MPGNTSSSTDPDEARVHELAVQIAAHLRASGLLSGGPELLSAGVQTLDRRATAKALERADVAKRKHKVDEIRVRRMAQRRGWSLVRSRRRDPRATGYGTYGVYDFDQNAWVIRTTGSDGYGLSLERIERWLVFGV
jgi:hypothetical protein